MKPKNIMLLGFVNRAVEYLDKHMDEEPNARLAQLKNIDLESIKDELSDNLDASLGTMQSTMATLLKAGNEAFDEFIEDSHGKDYVKNQFDKIFDVNLDSDQLDKKDNQEELARLLSFYNLENDFDDETEVETPVEEPIEEDNYEPIEDDAFMSEIRKNATKEDTDDILPIEHNEKQDAAIDSIFTEIVNHENNPVIQETITVIENPAIEQAPVEETVVEETATDSITYIENPAVDQQVEEQPVEETVVEVEQSDVQHVEQPNVEEPKAGEIKVIENPGVNEKSLEEAVSEEKPVEETNTYVSTLIDDLREQLVKEEELKKQYEIKNKAIYEHISKIYPYLPEGFVRSVYELKESISNDYPSNESVIILHRVSFKDVENLRKFAEIVLSHDYTINVDENKMIVDIFKRFNNTDGKILTNIYEIANQGYLLNGIYEGYNVIVE